MICAYPLRLSTTHGERATCCLSVCNHPCTQRTSNLRAQSSTNIQKEKSVKAALLHASKKCVCAALQQKFYMYFFLSWNNIKKQQHAYNDDILVEHNTRRAHGCFSQFPAVRQRAKECVHCFLVRLHYFTIGKASPHFHIGAFSSKTRKTILSSFARNSF